MQLAHHHGRSRVVQPVPLLVPGIDGVDGVPGSLLSPINRSAFGAAFAAHCRTGRGVTSAVSLDLAE